MSVKIVDNTLKIIADTNNGIPLVIRMMLDDVDRIADPRTPKDKGNLRRDKIKTVIGNHGTITWWKNYAVFLEKKQFSHYTTPGTGPHFAENAVKQVAKKSDTYFKKARLI